MNKEEIMLDFAERLPRMKKHRRTRLSVRAQSRSPVVMKAAAIDRFGPPSALKLHWLPLPKPGPHDVLIALHSAGVGIWDTEVRAGNWRPFKRPRFPLVIGTDGAGIVAAKGARVRRFRTGERVWAFHIANPKGGFYAEFVAVDANHVWRVPRRLKLLEAGAGVVTALTALQGIDDVLRVRRNETVLIFGASGAVGTLAIQFAKRRRARVLATASGREATALVRRLGADGVVDPRAQGFLEQLRKLAPKGIDAVLALAGGNALERCLELVRARGRVAYPNGVEPAPSPRRGIRSRAYNGEVSPRHFAQLDRAAEEARLEVPIAAVFPLAQTAKAHQRLEKGHVAGRVALRIRGKG